MKKAILFLPLLLLLASCGPKNKAEFLKEIHVLIEEDMTGQSNALFRQSPEERAERINTYLTDYYEDFEAECTPEEKAALFGEVALYYMTKSGVNADSLLARPIPGLNITVNNEPILSDSAVHQIGQTVKVAGKVMFEAGRAAWQVIKEEAIRQHKQDSILRADSLKHMRGGK